MAAPSGQSPLMQFNSMRPNENSFKISLKSPNSLKSMQTNGQIMAGGGTTTNILPNVSSTNPKTPSPCTNDVSLVKFK